VEWPVVLSDYAPDDQTIRPGMDITKSPVAKPETFSDSFCGHSPPTAIAA
jgi:hypothetical protein